MPYLPSLIRKIDEYCREAEDFSTIKRFAASWDELADEPSEDSSDEYQEETPPYFDELMNAARQVDDPELSQQLQTLAELYSYAIRMGGGYATIARAINNLKNMYSDGADSGIEYILNGMIKELAKGAGSAAALSGNDNPTFVQRLAQLKQDIESRNQEERSEALDTYQEEIGKGVGESSEDLAEAGLTPEQADIVNPAALGFDNKEDPKTNKGWHTVGKGVPYKNWQEYYSNERASYETDLASETDPTSRKTLEELISLLPILSGKTKAALDLSNAIRSDVANPTEEAKMRAQLDGMRTELQNIKKVRQTLRDRIRRNSLEKEGTRLSEEVQSLSDRYQTSVDPERKEKARRALLALQQQQALNGLAISTDVYKAKKRNYILQMIRAMSGGSWPSQDWIDKQQQKIDDAKTIKKEDYDRAQTIERAKEHGKIGDVGKKIPGQRGGGLLGEKQQQPSRQKSLYDVSGATFSGLVDKFSEKINTAAHVARLNITQTVVDKKKVHNELKPFVDKVSKAIQKKDNAAKLTAIRELKQQMKNRMDKAPAIKALARNTRWLPFFQRMKADLEIVAGWQTENGWNLNENKTSFIQNLIKNGKQIVGAYRKYYPESGPKRANQLEIAFDSTVGYMNAVLDQLSQRTGITT